MTHLIHVLTLSCKCLTPYVEVIRVKNKRKIMNDTRNKSKKQKQLKKKHSSSDGTISDVKIINIFK